MRGEQLSRSKPLQKVKSREELLADREVAQRNEKIALAVQPEPEPKKA